MKKFCLYILGILLFPLTMSAFSDIICVRNNLTTNDVIIRWNHTQEPCGSFQKYVLYAATTSAGPFTPIDSTFLVTDTNFTHIAALSASANWYYYVDAVYNCTPAFITTSDTSQNTAPTIPIIKRVSMGPKGAIIEWEPSH